MARCDVCGAEVVAVVGCSECGKLYCKECARSDPSMAKLGVCGDCEEAWQAEDDLDADEEDD